MSQCNGIFTDQSIFRYFSREMGQFQSSTRARFSKDKTMRPHVNMSRSSPHVDTSPCLWLQLVTEVPVGIWIGHKFKVKIDRFVKTSWQEYGVVAGSYWWAPAMVDLDFAKKMDAQALIVKKCRIRHSHLKTVFGHPKNQTSRVTYEDSNVNRRSSKCKNFSQACVGV